MPVVLHSLETSSTLSVSMAVKYGRLFMSDSEVIDEGVASMAEAGHNLTFLGTQDDVNTALTTVWYAAPPDWNSPGQGTFETLTVMVDEPDRTHSSDSYYGVSRTLVIHVVPVNDPPSLRGPSEVVAVENYTTLIRGIELLDLDSHETRGTIEATLSVTTPGAVLELGSGLGLYITQSSDERKSFQGTLHNINIALAGLTYRAPPEFSGKDELQVTVDDRGNTGEGGSLTASLSIPIFVSSVNNPPRVMREGGLFVSGVEDEELAVGGVVLEDPDSGGEIVRLTVEALHGSISFGGDVSELEFVQGTGLSDPGAVILGSIKVRS